MTQRANPRTKVRKFLLARAATLAALLLATSARAERIVAIGDVHGSLEGLTTILRTTGLIDEQNRWAGGDATLVQVGDLTDRGPHVRAVLDLMMALEEQAPKAGGRVVALLGNHEVNNLVTYFGFEATPPKTFAAIVGDFTDQKSPSRSRKAYSAWRKWQKRYPQCGADHTRDTWLAERPVGYVEYVEAIGPEGRYGRWLRARQAVIRIDDTIFLHGGLAPDPPAVFPSQNLEEINRQVALEIERYDADRAWLVDQGMTLPFSTLSEVYCAVRAELALVGTEDSGSARERQEALHQLLDRFPLPEHWLSFNADGPLWFRGYANWTDAEGAPLVDRLTQAYGVGRFVVGHTPQTGTIKARFDDRVFLIDTAMVFGAAAGGRPSALEIDDDESRAVYEGDPAPAATQDPAAAPPEAASGASSYVWLDPDDNPLPLTSQEEVARFLLNARVESTWKINVGVTQPRGLMLVQGSLRSRAVFRHVDITKPRLRLSSGKTVMFFRDHFINEVAAYELARMLGMNNIPPTVLRKVGAEPGSVQMWVENSMMETERREKKIEPPNRLRFTRQFYDMRVFDNLINNIDRNSGNILLDEDWKMWLIDHTRAFSRAKELPAPRDVVGCSRALFAAIRALDDDQVTERLRPYLGLPEITALHERRRRLVALIEQLVAERGESQVLFDYGAPDGHVRVSHDSAA
jgi:hypothetical protein